MSTSKSATSLFGGFGIADAAARDAAFDFLQVTGAHHVGRDDETEILAAVDVVEEYLFVGRPCAAGDENGVTLGEAFDEAFVEVVAVSSDKRSQLWWAAVEFASILGRAMKSSSRTAVMRPRIAGNLRHTS